MVRGGIVGCGAVVDELHMPAWAAIPGARIDAVCDVDEARARALGSRWGVPRCYGRLDDFLRDAAGLDFVVVATPGFTHFDVCREVIERGLHVLVEKPLALRLKDALSLRDAATARGLKVSVLHTWRYREPVLAAQRERREGVLGNVYQVSVVHHGESLYHSFAEWKWQEERHRVLLYELAFHFLDLQVLFAGPAVRLLGTKVVREEALGCVSRVYALVEHLSGVVGVVDLQMFASSNFTHLEVYGSANDVRIKFFPHYYRVYSGRVNPVDELYYDYVRVKDFLVTMLRAKFRRPAVPRRALPHHHFFVDWVAALSSGAAQPVPIDEAMTTMEYLELLSEAVYPE